MVSGQQLYRKRNTLCMKSLVQSSQPIKEQRLSLYILRRTGNGIGATNMQRTTTPVVTSLPQLATKAPLEFSRFCQVPAHRVHPSGHRQQPIKEQYLRLYIPRRMVNGIRATRMHRTTTPVAPPVPQLA